MSKRVFGVLVAAWIWGSGLVQAESVAWTKAYELYQKTDYQASLDTLTAANENSASAFLLMGQDYFMLADYKKATEALEKSAALNSQSAEAYMWLGRTYGRRAEIANPFIAPGLASKARQNMEKAVQLSPGNRDAIGDLFDYYLEAPGFLGGGQDKAEALIARVEKQDPAEGHYYRAVLADKRKQYDSAEQHFRDAMQLAPRQVTRVIDLAKYVAKRGRTKESEDLFDQAAKADPNNPRIMFERASTYIREQRNLPQAKKLLERYLRSPLTPDDPPRQEAEALLKKIGA